MDRLKKARELPKFLEHERKVVEKAIKDSLMVEQVARQEEGERKAVESSAKALKFVETISEKPPAADLVVELTQALNGSSLEQAFMNILKAKLFFEDLQTEKRYLEETHNITVDPLPECPDLSYADELKIAIEKILGRKLENIKRNARWHRVWASQRAADRDAAAKRLGLLVSRVWVLGWGGPAS